MAADLVTLANSVTTALNSLLAELGYAQRAVRTNRPRHKNEELQTLKITVYPMGRPARINAKGGALVETQPIINIDFRQHVGENNQAREDVLIELAEVITERFLKGVTGLTGVMEADTSAVYPTDEMIEHGVFAAGIALTFSVGRAPR